MENKNTMTYSIDLVLIVYFILIGCVNAMTSIAIDFGMKAGHLLGFIRLWRVRLAAISNPKVDWADFEKKVTEGKNKPFSERIDYFNDLYWDVATDSFWLPVWLCVKCMSYRIFFLVWIVAIIWMGLNATEAFCMLFLGAASNMATIILMSSKKAEVTVKHESACSH